MSYASRFAMNSDFAAFKSEGEIMLKLVLPDIVNISDTDEARVFKVEAPCGTAGASAFRVIVDTNKQYTDWTTSPSFLIPAKENGYDAFINGSIYKKDGKFVLEAIITPPGFGTSNWTNMAQTITARIQSYTDPYARNKQYS